MYNGTLVESESEVKAKYECAPFGNMCQNHIEK